MTNPRGARRAILGESCRGGPTRLTGTAGRGRVEDRTEPAEPGRREGPGGPGRPPAPRGGGGWVGKKLKGGLWPVDTVGGKEPVFPPCCLFDLLFPCESHRPMELGKQLYEISVWLPVFPCHMGAILKAYMIDCLYFLLHDSFTSCPWVRRSVLPNE